MFGYTAMASDGIAFLKPRNLIPCEHPLLGQHSSEYARLEILQGSRSSVRVLRALEGHPNISLGTVVRRTGRV